MDEEKKPMAEETPVAKADVETPAEKVEEILAEEPAVVTEEVAAEETAAEVSEATERVEKETVAEKVEVSEEKEPAEEVAAMGAAEKPTKKKKVWLIVIVVMMLAAVGVLAVGTLAFGWFGIFETGDLEQGNSSEEDEVTLVDYEAEDFDLAFLKLEKGEANKIYSPLSLKYALGMLAAGTSGDSREQIQRTLGEFTPKVYANTQNMSFANALFVRDGYRDEMKSSYVADLRKRFGAEVIYDAFQTPKRLNDWVSDKTLGMIDDLLDDVSGLDFVLTNALAIDMEWVNQIQSVDKDYYVNLMHEGFALYVSALDDSGYHKMSFGEDMDDAKTVMIGAVVNNYDIVADLGEEKIRQIVGDEYDEWLADDENYCWETGPDDDRKRHCEEQPDKEAMLDQYMEEIGKDVYGHGVASSSTDFKLYVDDEVKVFAKDLKEYSGTTLQYVGIMPQEQDLADYVKNLKMAEVKKLIGNLKTIEAKNFKEGVLTNIHGYIPMFKFDYKLELMKDLKALGVMDVFDGEKADLSEMVTSKGASITKAEHKADIEFSNDGIKAAAATAIGGKGGAGGGFDYLFEIPVEEIDLTFDKPYLFLIRDKATGEVWFVGTVYQPAEYQQGE